VDQPEPNDISPQDKRRIQKLQLRVRHLDEELVQAEDLRTDYESEFNSMTHQLRVNLGIEKEKDQTPEQAQKSDEPKKCNINPGTFSPEDVKIPERDEEDLRHEIDNSSAMAPAWMKKAYKQIVMKTHPDRIAQNSDLSPYEVAEYNRLFETAKTAVQAQNGGDIVYVAEQLGIDAGIPSAMRISLLVSRAENIKNKILKIYKTPSWLWGESYGNRPARKRIVETYCKIFKYDISDSEFVDKFLDELKAK
jgi:hypothetical protein